VLAYWRYHINGNRGITVFQVFRRWYVILEAHINQLALSVQYTSNFTNLMPVKVRRIYGRLPVVALGPILVLESSEKDYI